jgi:basic membrane protein A
VNIRSLRAPVIIFICLTLFAPSLAACTPQESNCASTEVFCVGLVTEIGPVKDQGPNQAAWIDLQRAKEENLVDQVAYIETVNTKDYAANIRAFVEVGYDLVVTIGYGAREATFAAAERYPDTLFIGMDQPLPASPPLPTDTETPFTAQTAIPESTPTAENLIPGNLTLVIYPEDQAGFLAGALAAMMTQTQKVGAVCESEGIETIKLYCEGFKAGVAYINPAVSPLIKYREGSLEKTFADPEWGSATANNMINDGADVIFAVGGQTAEGALRTAAEDNIYVIGSEIDQFYALPEVRDVLLSSALKKFSPTLYDLLVIKLKAPKKALPIYAGQVGYAPLHKLEKIISAIVQTQMQDLEQAFKDGTLETGVTLDNPQG